MSFTELRTGARTKFGRFITDDGLITGAANANLEFASLTRWTLKPLANEVLACQDLTIFVGNTGVFKVEEYGALGTALTNGINFGYKLQNGSDVSLINSRNIKTNAEWATFCFDVEVNNFGVGLGGYITARYFFSSNATDGPLILGPGDELFVTINDDLRGLETQCFMVRGDRYTS